MLRLEIEAASGRRWSYPLRGDRATIGRSQDNDVCLPDQWLSRHHAEIQRRGDDYLLIDLKSRNGSYVNESRVRGERRIAPGDVIRLGEHRLKLLEEERTTETTDQLLTTEAVPPGTRIFTTSELFLPPALAAADAATSRERQTIGLIAEAASGLLVEHRALPETFDRILTLLMGAVPAERGAILLLEGDPPAPVVKASHTLGGESIQRISRSIARKVVEERVVLLIPNIMEDDAFKLQESIFSTDIRSVLCAPLWFRSSISAQDAVIGLVYLDTRQRARTLSEADVPIVSALANIAAAKIENLRLIEESIEKRRLEDDVRIAAEVQVSLLPREAPRIAGYDLIGSTRPCHAVGGDYYDLLVQGQRLLFALGDVAGKGTSAALLMTVLRAAARAHWRDNSPSAAMGRINRTVFENTPPNRFVTFFLGALDLPNGELRFVNAGHNPSLLLRADGQTERLLDGGVALGLFENVTYAEGKTRLRPGDTLLLYSDGLTETWNEHEQEFGEAGLIEVALRRSGLSAAALESEIFHELERFAPATHALDDRTLLILKRL